MTAPFSTRLREATATIHSDVENRRFMVDLMDGRLSARAYATLLGQYRPLYSALEAQARRLSSDPTFRAFADPRLERLARIDHDLEQMGFESIEIMDSTRAYAARIAEVDSPEQLLAHHYTRYLGDLSGGLAIGALMARHYSLPESALTMWDFSALGKTKVYKDEYRRRLDDVRSTGGDEESVIAEARLAFELNGRIFSEIGVLFPADAALPA